jgi:hypothetical protein
VLIKVHATAASADRSARTRKVPRGFGLIAPFVFGFSAAIGGVDVAD